MATTKATLPGYERISGRSERFRIAGTEQTISRRQYDKIRRGISNEQLRDINREKSPTEFFARPARGRTSARKLAPEIKADIALARKEYAEQKARKAQADKEKRQLQTKIERQKNKKVRRKKVRKQLLKPGHMGTRISFSEFEEFEEALSEARKIGVVFAYGLGWHGVDERTGISRDVTVLTMTSVRDSLDEETFTEMMQTSQEEKSYLIFLNYFMHIAFRKDFAESWAIQHGKGNKKSVMEKFR